MAGIQRKEDFDAEIRPLADLRKKMLEHLQEALATPESDGTPSLQQVPEDVRTMMRNLGTLAVAVEVDAVPEIRTLSKDQFLPAPTGTGEGVVPFVSTVVKLEDRLRGVLETSVMLSYLEGTSKQGGNKQKFQTIQGTIRE